MSQRSPILRLITISLIGLGAGWISGVAVPAVRRKMSILGLYADLSTTAHGDFLRIPNTLHCEDVHYYEPSHQLFAACQADSASRYVWFPPVGNMQNASVAWASKGHFTVIDPETKESQVLAFENFDSPFITHGIDIISDPATSSTSTSTSTGADAIYIYAVNHLPNPAIYPQDPLKPPPAQAQSIPDRAYEAAKCHSQIEVFHHVIGSPSVRHIRSIRDPLIRTPNDIYAESPTSFYVTNDHYYREGNWRMLEDLYTGAAWTDLIHVQIESEGGAPTPAEPAESVIVTVAKDGLYNANGLGHGRSINEMLLGSCMGGELYLCQHQPGSTNITVKDTIRSPTLIDNPYYFKDHYPTTGGGDASGFLLPATTRPLDLAKGSEELGAIVWYAKPDVTKPAKEWIPIKLYEDDGKKVTCGTTAVLVGIDPVKEGGKKKGWLFVTGFMNVNIVAVKVDL